ncbi:hypothetical protein INT48_000616 [Thamnidium elegans]|uniref:BZIP domain-containing protein n=1 Tax=Thamnidium elegans TaxID=101142 RepID=A0A8H7VQU0_9FUNG|nr:hypothetical protein INT48_000616 [Thamnidium elegans]
MSASPKDNTSDTPLNRFAFQHFDQECDFGIENEEGERIRKRKKPGRKPNPPSLQERRAQNRAAQKAFREREQQRKMEKEKQWQDFHLEISDLKDQLAIAQFETRYLKACVLHLTLSSLVHRGSVPHIWTESRIIPSNSNGEYKNPLFKTYHENVKDEVHQIPALLDMLLENKCVVDFDKALFATTQNNTFSNFMKKKGDTSPELLIASYESYIKDDIITLNKNSQEPRRNFPKENRKRAKISPVQTAETIDQDMSLKKEIQQPSPPEDTMSPVQQYTHLDDASSPRVQLKPQSQPIPQTTQQPYIPQPTTNSQTITIQRKPLVGVIYEPPLLKTSEDFVNMPSSQALHILRLQLKLGSILGNMTPAALLPTALQRVIPHDLRIDYVPGASIRDRMILFQGYYDIDECFDYLTQKSVFMGGDVRDSRNWEVDPKYSMQFWFISHLLVDQSYDDFMDNDDANILRKEYVGDDSDDSDEDNNGEHISAERSTASTRKSFRRSRRNGTSFLK